MVYQRLPPAVIAPPKVGSGLSAAWRCKPAAKAELPSAARTLVQAGLFDRRALRRLEARNRSVAAIAEQLDIQSEQAAASQTLVRTVELVAVLLV